MKTMYEIAKHTIVIAKREIIYGRTTRILWLKGSGPENRESDISSNMPILTKERFVFRIGSMIVIVESW